ncbi:IncF plasmid conjugative transfer pilus assembly protein TraF [Candidatus Glomeribacter gigasporarum BEG34]|uniref:IncF plasmid conjugative transfer pilus assembly protein TraF n=2 Tax=Candidatus Glomeribacter gigasporarum TaxID=132144 RepID=G2JBM2_9BURK|nr:IncF plasmid conjugative transfer pilus assembly protein TraF [Candidatus Glomeribacter gigasporarum BEG34]
MPVVMTVLLLALIASAIPAAAADRVFADNPPVRFYWRKAEGWFWYEPIPEPTKPERPLPEQPARSPTARQTTAPTVFSAAWFRQNLPKYKDLAWDHPTLTNLRAFLWVQRLALDRARQFADMSELATLGDPLLDALSQRPYATFAAHTLDRQAGTAQARLLNELAQRVGLLFFFHSTCPACATQAPLVRMLAKQHRFSLIPVSIDGQDLPGHPFPAFKPDRGQAAKLQVQAVPALYLTAPNGQFAAVGQGAMSLPEIQRRLLVVAKRQQWITDAAFNQARPVRALDRPISNPAQGASTRPSLNNATGFIPPAQLVRAFRPSVIREAVH